MMLCCLCGLSIEENPMGMCMTCLKAHVDITEKLQKEYILDYCPECQRYLQPPKYWSRAELESRELMVICLKKVKGLNKYKLTDAAFVWTEEHSKRIKLKLVLQQEVFAKCVLQQNAIIEFVVHWRQCDRCARAATGQDQWAAVVQLRQRVDHKRTFLYLEQLILKHRMHEASIKIESQGAGLDFYFGNPSPAKAFKQFIAGLAPVTSNEAVQLVSHDSKTNTAIQHHTFSLEIAPLCRDDLVCLPPNVRKSSLGGIGPLVLVHKVYSSIVFVDPKTLQAQELQGSVYWKNQFPVLAAAKHLTEFYVVDIEPEGIFNGKFRKAQATVQLASEVGSEREWVVPTHLGKSLKPGDYAKGYFLESLNTNDPSLDKYPVDILMDVVLVRKHYPNQKRRRGRRNWEVKRLEVAGNPEEEQSTSKKKRTAGGLSGNANDAAQEAEEFLDEIERDKELRDDLALYKKTSAVAGGPSPHPTAPTAAEAAQGEEEDEDDDDVVEVGEEELIDELAAGATLDEEEAQVDEVGEEKKEEQDEEAESKPEDDASSSSPAALGGN